MFKPDQVFIVRNRFRPPVVEHAWVASATEEGIELIFSAVVPYKPGEQIQVIAETDEGRIACSARARCATSAGRWFEIDAWRVLEQRRNPRIAVDIPAVLRCEHLAEIHGRLKNLSAEGFLFEGPARVVGATVDISFVCGGIQHTFPCKVVLSRPGSVEDTFYAHLQLETDFDAVCRCLSDVFNAELAAAIRSGSVSTI